MTECDSQTVLQTAAQVAQVIVGVVALWVAHRAHKATQRSNDDLFLEMLFPELAAVIQASRRVQHLYRRLFDEHKSTQEKQLIHVQWVRSKEEAARKITQLKLMFPSETTALCEAWVKMDEEEDSHTGTNHLAVPAPAAEKALGRMEQLQDRVHSEAAAIVKKERERRRAD